MSRDDKGGAWLPENGKEFIRSEEFGEIVLGLCQKLGQQYPTMDFSDAASQVFSWFDRKLSTNRRFINKRRFATKSAFVAYVRQSVWNSARLMKRERQRHNRIAALPVDQAIAGEEIAPGQFAELREAVERLPEPHKAILKRIVFDEDDKAAIASDYYLSVSKVGRVYVEAIDLLGKLLE